jgi:hypothetical protein
VKKHDHHHRPSRVVREREKKKQKGVKEGVERERWVGTMEGDGEDMTKARWLGRVERRAGQPVGHHACVGFV